MLSASEFYIKFPEFTERVDEPIVASLIEQIELETNSYSGLDSELKQKQAIALRVAFEIEKASPVDPTSNGNVKKVESLNDVIEYATSDIDASSYDQNKYGQRLKRFLRSNFFGFSF